MRALDELSALFHELTPVHGIFMAVLEALFPPLPLAAIVGINVAKFGMLRGFLYSFLGSVAGCMIVFCFFHTLSGKIWVKRVFDARCLSRAKRIVEDMRSFPLFLLLMFPFTPSAFMNFAFGICGYPVGKYFCVLIPAKVVMIWSLSILGKSVEKATRNPIFIVLSLAMFLCLYLLSGKVTKKYGESFHEKD